MELYEVIFKQLECIMRGKRIDENSLLSQSEELLNWSLNEYKTKGSQGIHFEREIQQKFIDLAVKLHNKSKSVYLNSKVFSEIITNLKASAAWILTTYGHANTKFVIMFIRLHCRAASELIALEKFNFAEASLRKVAECWKMLNSQALERILPPVDLEGLRFVVFNSFLDYSKLLRTTGGSTGNEEEIKNCIGCALELLENLPDVRLTFSRHVLDIGQELAIHKSAYNEAIHYLRIALSSLHVIQTSKNLTNRDDLQDESRVLLTKTYLSMAFVYQELNEIEKGLSSVRDAETLGNGFVSPETILFAKFSLLCRACNETEASETLIQLIEATPSFEMALNSLVLFLKGVGSENLESYHKYLDYFLLIGKKFSSDPDFSMLRILHLQYTFLALRATAEEQTDEYFIRSKEIYSAIIRDHQQRIRPLSKDHYNKFLHLLQERVNLHRSQGTWIESIYWCDVMLSFVETSDQSNWTAIMMWKSDSCLHISERREEALTLAMACVKMIKSTNTILLAFNTALHICPPNQVVEMFISMLKEYPGEIHQVPDLRSSHADSVDYLRRIILGCQVLAECPSSHLDTSCSETGDGKYRDFIKSSLLVEWIQNYSLCRVDEFFHQDESASMDLSVNIPDSSLQNSTGSEISFCDILLELLSTFLRNNLSSSQDPNDLGEDESKVGEPPSQTRPEPALFNRDLSCYQLLCSPDFLKSHLFGHFRQLLAILEESKESVNYDPPIYRDLESLEVLAQLSWNLGILLSGNSSLQEWKLDHMIFAIEWLEMSERIFFFLSMKGNNNSQHETSRFKCLLSSTSLRLDVSTNLANLKFADENIPAIHREDESFVLQDSSNLSQLSENIQMLSQLLNKIQNETQLQKLFLILSLAVHCRTNNPDIDSFVEENQGRFLSLTPQELEKCGDITQNERYGNLGICRKMIQFAIQVSARETSQDYQLLGSLFKRLIQISPNRLQALERIEDFEQVIKSQLREGSDELPFSASDIDSICLMCYNWGVTLVELSQYDLAEKFACKALSFTKFVSSNVSKLKETIQDAYLYILKTKVEQKEENLTANIAHFGLTSSSLASSLPSSLQTNPQYPSAADDIDTMLVTESEKELPTISLTD